jgi:hypothetical protein
MMRSDALRSSSMSDESGPMIAAVLAGGPLDGTTTQVPAVEGRPPKTVDVACGDTRVRYGLSGWEQSGHSAQYSYLYEA